MTRRPLSYGPHRDAQLGFRVIGNEPPMTQRRSKFSALALCLASTAVSACAPKMVIFDDTLVGIDVHEAIADLNDDQALQVCAWLVAAYPTSPCASGPPSNTDDCPLVVPGYVSARASGVECNQHEMLLEYLTQDNCILNLRHSPCQATVGVLEQCVGDVKAALESEFATSNSAGDICDGVVNAACAAFEAAPSCDETVFQAAQSHTKLCCGAELDCTGVPVLPGVTCPPTIGEPADSGTFSLPDGCGGDPPNPCPPALFPDGALYALPDGQVVY